MNMDKVKSYIEANNDRFINELFDLIRIPSISAEAGSTLITNTKSRSSKYC